MADLASVSCSGPVPSNRVGAEAGIAPRHSAMVRITHWITALCFLALLVSGVELIISHPRFYWGEEGNINTQPLFSIPIPASRGSVPTGYKYVLPDQNGWSRYLHFQTAWILVGTGLWYVAAGLFSGHFRRHLLPSGSDLSPSALAKLLVNHLRLNLQKNEETYNPLQRLAYLAVVFAAFPLMIWTGLAMSPAVTSALPFLVNVLGGHQSARTLHFFATLFLVLFVMAHILMVSVSGFRSRMSGIIIGTTKGES